MSRLARVLEDARYAEVRKGAVGRRPRTWFRLTSERRQAVEDHLAWLSEMEETVFASAGRGSRRGPSLVIATNRAGRPGPHRRRDSHCQRHP